MPTSASKPKRTVTPPRTRKPARNAAAASAPATTTGKANAKPTSPARAPRRLPLSGAFVHDAVFGGAWRLRAGPGECLDIVVDATTGVTRLVSVPIGLGRHLFRVERVQDLRTRQWRVQLHPVALGEPSPAAPARRASARAAGSRRAAAVRRPHHAPIPMRLIHHGCLDFELKNPVATPQGASARRAEAGSKRAGAKRAATAAASAPAPTVVLPKDTDKVSIDLHLTDLLRETEPTPFPTFSGDEARAFASIARQSPAGPRSKEMDEASLLLAHRPKDIPKAAWNNVSAQLLREIHYRNRANAHFDRLQAFVHEVFIGNASVVEELGRLMQLDDGQFVRFASSALFGAISGAVNAVPILGSGVVAKCLEVAFKTLQAPNGLDADVLAVALSDAKRELVRVFDRVISGIHATRAAVLEDWSKLQLLGEGLDEKKGPFLWPTDDQPQKDAARDQLELALWKAMLKLRWCDITYSTGAEFATGYTDASKAAFEAANLPCWIRWWNGARSEVTGSTQGQYVEYHWLAVGSSPFDHVHASDALCKRLYELMSRVKLTRGDLFTSKEWALPQDTLRVPNSDYHWSGT